MKPPTEVVSDKLITFIEGLLTSDLPRQIDHPKYTTLTKDTVVLDVMLQNYFKGYFLEDVICENCSSDGPESIKSTFTVSRYLKKLLTVLKTLLQRGTYDMTSGEALTMNLKLLYLLNIFTNNHLVMRRSHTP